MKAILKSTFFYFFIATTFTGSIYKIIENSNEESLLVLIGYNVMYFIIAFAFSYLGFLTQRKKEGKNN